MKHIIIGTAGHVDHGKTALVRALTGTDTDRLPEEKRRGLTIELGFAHLALAEELGADIIDVPGHEKFLRNMLTGAGQVDVALLVVAADEGVMPQTLEHLEILTLLGVPLGVVALSRCDLANRDMLERTRRQLAQCLMGTFLENAPVVETCVVTGAGLPELKAALGREAECVAPKEENTPFRMPIDRIFTVPGFGTVATGVLLRGTLLVGQTAVLRPGGRALRIRGLQCHGEAGDCALPGRRVAVNLAGISAEALHRGQVL